MSATDRPFVPRPSRASARNGRDGDEGTKGRDGTPRGEQPLPATEEADARKAQDSEKPVVILPAGEFRINEVLRHIEAGEIVLIIPANQQRGPPAE